MINGRLFGEGLEFTSNSFASLLGVTCRQRFNETLFGIERPPDFGNLQQGCQLQQQPSLVLSASLHSKHKSEGIIAAAPSTS